MRWSDNLRCAESVRYLLRGFRAGSVVLALLAAPWLPATAQIAGNWRSVGPPGGTVLALAKSPRASAVLYAGTLQNGVFMSADAGQTWTPANAGLPATTGTASRSVRALIADTQYLYAATDAGMFYAAAGVAAGDLPNWSPLPATGATTPMSQMTLLAVDVPSGKLFAATTAVTAGAAPVVYGLALPAPAAAPAGPWVASPMPAEVVDTGIGAMAVVPGDGTSPTSLLVSALDHVYSAPINGAAAPLSWLDADPSRKLRGQGAIEALHYSADFTRAYACSGSQMFVATLPQDPASNDWTMTTLPAAGAMALTCNAMTSGGLPAASSVVALATNAGVYWSMDGTTFTPAMALAVSPTANAVMIAGDTPALFVGAGFGVASQALGSITAGSNWIAVNGPAMLPASGANNRLNNTNVTDITVVGSALYVGVASEQYADVLISTDAGATWSSTGLSQVAGSQAEIRALAADSTNRVVYAGTNAGLYALAAGAAWQPVAATTLPNVVTLARDGSLLYVGTDAGVFSFTLGTSPASVMAAPAGLDTLRVSALLVAGGKLYAGTQDIINAGTASVSVATSVSAGSPIWSRFANGDVGTHRINSLALAGSTLLVGTQAELVSMAIAGGPWSDASIGIRDPANPADLTRIVTALYSDGTTVFAATGSHGLFSAPVSSVGSGFLWAPFNGSGDQALPSLELRQLRGEGTLLYAATAAGLASFDGVVPVVMPPPAPGTPPPVADSGGGGGAFDFWSLLGLALLVCLLAAIGKSNHKAD